ncbi:MAG: hypothetical protein Fur0010_20120 [Bdellovibrio sp.]
MQKFKIFFKKHWFNLVLFVFLGVIILPNAWFNFSQEGQTIDPQTYQVLGEENTIELPNNQRVMLLFWATWCGPCHIEMDRLKQSVETGKIRKEQIFALSPFENEREVKQFLEKSPYPFRFLIGQSPLVIKQTPTTVLLDGNKIHSMKSGMSLIGIFLAEKFLNN